MILVALTGISLVAPPVRAEPPRDRPPSAELVIQKKGATSLRWYGVGDLRSKNDICVASDTGRYRLRLQLTGGKAAAIPDFDVSFSTTAGDNLTRRSSEGDVLLFEGRTMSRTDCRDGTTNATIEFRFTRDGLSAAVAGEYLERVQISVEPA